MIEKFKRCQKIEKKEWIFLFIVTIIYSFFALFDLGDRKAPESFYTITQGHSMTFSFDEEISFSSIDFYLGPTSKVDFQFEFFNPTNNHWESIEQTRIPYVFAWNSIPFSYNTTAIRMTCLSEKATLMEIVFKNSKNEPCMPSNGKSIPELFDEQVLYPKRISFRNSTYFDEIYHARTAYEYIHGLTTYEISHPPLGKLILSLGILLFGMTPFGWRIMGTFLGILMVPVIYLFAKKILKDSFLAKLTCLLFTFDFMHFSQTRIATIDVYGTFFILLMYYFMYLYLEKSHQNASLKESFLPLGACGIFMGLAIASKWTGIYGALGLAILFFCSLFTHKKGLSYIGKTVAFCCVFFVIIPIGIYILSYIPFVPKSDVPFLQGIWENQKFMFSYHSQLQDTHPYASPSYSWPIILRPIWYYSGVLEGSLREGISAFGNPLVWWPGIPAFFYLLIYSFKKKDKIAFFLIVGYLSQYLPWFFITRPIFIYHYFPSVIFVALMNGYSLKLLQNYMKPNFFKFSVYIYGFLVILLFLMFYPVLSGQPVDTNYVSNFLRWFPTWVLTKR